MRFMKTIEFLLNKVLFFLMFLIAISVIWQVIARYIFSDPATWPDEVSRFSMMWVALLGGVSVYAQGKHLAVTILPEKWAGTMRGHYLQSFFHFLILILGILMTYGGFFVAHTNYVNGQLSAVMHLNMGLIYLCVPISGILIIIYATAFMLCELKASKIKES